MSGTGALRRRAIAALVAAAVAVGACSTDREVTSPEPEPVTAERLAEALLTLEDLPDGFAPSDATVSFASEVLPEHACDDALGQLDPEESTSTTFSGAGVSLTHALAWFPGQGAEVEQLLRQVGADCRRVVAADQAISIRTNPLDFGVLSDDTVALRIELEPSTGAIEERDLILRREGDLVSIVRVDGPRPSDKGLLDAAVRVTIGRLGRLHDVTT